METDMRKLVDALITEREGYVRRGRMDRVAEVDAQLRELGVENKYIAPVESATVQPVVEHSVRKKAAKKREI
jgi:hypothetical protein